MRHWIVSDISYPEEVGMSNPPKHQVQHYTFNHNHTQLEVDHHLLRLQRSLFIVLRIAKTFCQQLCFLAHGVNDVKSSGTGTGTLVRSSDRNGDDRIPQIGINLV